MDALGNTFQSSRSHSDAEPRAPEQLTPSRREGGEVKANAAHQFRWELANLPRSRKKESRAAGVSEQKSDEQKLRAS